VKANEERKGWRCVAHLDVDTAPFDVDVLHGSLTCANTEIIFLSPSYIEKAFNELQLVEKRGDAIGTSDFR
jgi:hypothetical protein